MKQVAALFRVQPRGSLGSFREGQVHNCQIQEVEGEEFTLRRPGLVEWANPGLIEESRLLF